VEGRRRLSLWRDHSFAAGDGAETQEVGGMRWSELDLAKRMWPLPKERTKGGRDHLVPLNDLAVETLRACPRIEERDCIFATRTENTFSGWNMAKRRLDARSGVRDWRLHDLRRTVATKMQAAGVLPHTVAAVLNHSTAGLFGVTAVYLRDRQEEAKHAAMDTWNGQLACVLALIAGGLPTERMVAHVLVTKYADHAPLYARRMGRGRQEVSGRSAKPCSTRNSSPSAW
jgi:integrase